MNEHELKELPSVGRFMSNGTKIYLVSDFENFDDRVMSDPRYFNYNKILGRYAHKNGWIHTDTVHNISYVVIPARTILTYEGPSQSGSSQMFSFPDCTELLFLSDHDYKMLRQVARIENTVDTSDKQAIRFNVLEKYDYQERDTHIPASFDKYYEIGMLNDGSIPEDDIPDAFDNYGGMTLLAVVYAKEQYEDALGDNCLDYCYLVEDGSKFALVTTAGQRVYYVDIAEVERCVNKDVDEDFNVREPSSVEYGNAISSYYKELTDTIEKYGIRKIGYKRAIGYDGVVNGYKFYFVEANTGTGHYAKELYINGREVNLYQSKDSERSFSTLNEMNYFGILSLVKMLETNNLSGIVYRDADTLDDYEDGIVESVEMSDAQRLALQELDACLEYGELSAEKHALAYQIQWDINFEDVLLFINGIDIDLKDIKYVCYGNCSDEYDGCYDVTLHDGTTKQYGWHDSDMTGSLNLIESTSDRGSNLQWGVHQFSTESIIFRGTEEECANYINDNELWNDAEVYMIKPDDRHYIHEDTSVKTFQPGDHVYVIVANRGGRVIKMISSDVVEVELDETFLYPARIDRYYVEEVELIATDDPDDDEDIEGLDPVVIEHPEDIDTYLADPDSKFIPDDDF